MKKALITGVTGQDGSYLAEFLLSGIRSSRPETPLGSFNTGRLDRLYTDLHEPGNRFFLHYADLTDASSLWSCCTTSVRTRSTTSPRRAT